MPTEVPDLNINFPKEEENVLHLWKELGTYLPTYCTYQEFIQIFVFYHARTIAYVTTFQDDEAQGF